MALQSRWLLVALVAFLFFTAAVAGTKKPKEPKAPKAPKAPKPPKAPKVPKELKEPKAAKEPKAPKAPKEKGGKTKDVPVFNNVTLPPANPGGVTYDGRSLIIKGSRDVLFSGSIHYPRFTPDMWPDILDKARHGGLNTISTYIFWNAHEPVPGKFNFEGNLDVIKFIRLIGEKGMYCVLRVGPYIEAEWTNGGLPYWIREVPGMVSRTDNGPFKMHMEKYVRKIIDMMKAAKLFIHQGGPIILAQIENEYSSVKGTTKEHGKRYIQWAGNMALATGAGVPWIMCKDEDAPSTVINTCNGRHCGDTFNGPNSPNKPSLWTENWTAQYRVWGNGPSQRAAEDLARSVTRFFSKDGTSTNYYMYYGGTNFGRSASEFTTTRYYDEAPLDEYGLQRGPKWYHLRDMHTALRMCKQALLFGTPSVQRISDHVEIRWYENREKNLCTAFFANNDTVNPATVKFQGKTFKVPTFSISILPDCKNVVLNTAEVISQHNSRNFVRSKVANKNLKWETSYEIIPTVQPPLKPLRDLEHFFLSKDTTDYVWYTTTVELNKFDLPMRKDIVPVLSITSHGHALLAFVNGEYVGTGHGEFRAQKFVFNGNVRNLKPGLNHIAILSIITGYPKSGAYMERKVAGPAHTRAGSISILGLNAGTIDLTNRPWGHQVGLSGEKIPVFTLAGSYRVKWTPNAKPRALSWYRAYFDAPEGRDPVALNLSSMSKGMVWVNGVSIGRYWVSYLSEQGKPTQSEYHIPRAFIKPTKNLLVVMDEEGKTPEKIEVMTVNRDTICSIIGEEYAPPLKASWEEGKDGKLKKIGDATPKVILGCPNYKKIVAVEFASYGTPEGTCGSLTPGKCNLNVKQMVEKACLGKTNCEIPVIKGAFGQPKGSCTAGPKTLAVQVLCAFGGGKQ